MVQDGAGVVGADGPTLIYYFRDSSRGATILETGGWKLLASKALGCGRSLR